MGKGPRIELWIETNYGPLADLPETLAPYQSDFEAAIITGSVTFAQYLTERLPITHDLADALVRYRDREVARRKAKL